MFVAGQIVWCTLDPTVGREQAGRRPCVVVSSNDYSEVFPQLALILPCTTRDRGWETHVLLTGPTGLSKSTYAVTEQLRTVSIQRIHGLIGAVDDGCLRELCLWLDTWTEAA